MDENSSWGQRFADQVGELLGSGYLGKNRVLEVASVVPELESNVTGLLRGFALARDWRNLERFAIVAAYIHPDGLGEILCDVLDSDEPGVNREDLVDLIGEIRYEAGVSPILRFMDRMVGVDAPYYSVCRKCIHSLGGIGTDESKNSLQGLTGSGFPDPIRWHAAVELEIETDLGFDEDEMLKYP